MTEEDEFFYHFSCTPDECEDDDPDCPKRGKNRCLTCGGPTLPDEDFCKEYCAMKYARDHNIPYVDMGDFPPGWDA